MSQELMILLVTAAFIGFLHILFGPDSSTCQLCFASSLPPLHNIHHPD
jgi:hypothetical protein